MKEIIIETTIAMGYRLREWDTRVGTLQLSIPSYVTEVIFQVF